MSVILSARVRLDFFPFILFFLPRELGARASEVCRLHGYYQPS